MKRNLLPLLLLPLLVGCRPERFKYLGKWTGSFEPVSVSAAAKVKDLNRNQLRGFLQIYGTESKFDLHLEGEQVGIDVTGQWVKEAGNILLNVKGVKIDDHGGEDMRNPNQAYLAATDIQQAFNAPIHLRLAKDNKSLSGILITVGPLTGRFEFKKDAMGVG